jgi:hypothetical protein
MEHFRIINLLNGIICVASDSEMPIERAKGQDKQSKSQFLWHRHRHLARRKSQNRVNVNVVCEPVNTTCSQRHNSGYWCRNLKTVFLGDAI